MRPHVVAHLAVSIDGVTTGFEADQARFYALATLWQEDVTLVGADTLLAQESAVRNAPRPGPREGGPLLAVVDSRHRVHNLDALRDLGYWSDVLGLYSELTPARPPDSTTQELVTGYDHVDLAETLAAPGAARCPRRPRRQRRHAARSTARAGPNRRAEPADPPCPRRHRHPLARLLRRLPRPQDRQHRGLRRRRRLAPLLHRLTAI